PETDSAAFDLGYAHYFYADNTSPDYGAIYASAEYYATDALTLGANTNYAPDYSQMGDYSLWLEGVADYALPAGFGVSGGLGYQIYAASLDLPDYWTWNAGVYWSWEDTLTIDLRYVGSDLSRGDCALLMSRSACGHRFVATLSIDTAVSALVKK
ncbi:MAG TPA: TorF family putative porin, partial [Bauldia sp.]|nr:TorF family putative porin [Bauldia sp.]